MKVNELVKRLLKEDQEALVLLNDGDEYACLHATGRGRCLPDDDCNVVHPGDLKSGDVNASDTLACVVLSTGVVGELE